MPALNEIATPYSNLPVSPDLYYYFQHFFLGVLGGEDVRLMRRYSEILKDKFYGKGWVHPYKTFEQKIVRLPLTPNAPFCHSRGFNRESGLEPYPSPSACIPDRVIRGRIEASGDDRKKKRSEMFGLPT
jgi:hypothetical protein